MDIYMNWLNYEEDEGRQFIDSISPKFKLAVEWQLAQAVKYGLPADLVNTFDEHGQIGDINSYNAFMYISSMSASIIIANMTSSPNNTFIQQIVKARDTGIETLHKLLWTGSFYRSFWCANGKTPENALQSDVLYGTVWDQMFNFNTTLPKANLVSHLHVERKRNLTPYGMQFCTGRGQYSFHCSSLANSTHSKKQSSHHRHYFNQSSHWDQKKFLKHNADEIVPNLGSGFQDQDTWEAHTLDSSILSLFLRATSDEDALFLSALTIDKYRLTFHDQWDYRDLSSCYSGDVPGATACRTRPVCNSHYSRQLIFWVLLVALGGQRYVPRSGGLLELWPRQIVCEQWPIVLGMGSALMRPVGHQITYTEARMLRDAEVRIDDSESDDVRGDMLYDSDAASGPVFEGVAKEGECYEIEVYSGDVRVKHLRLFGKTLAMEVSLSHHDIATYCF